MPGDLDVGVARQRDERRRPAAPGPAAAGSCRSARPRCRPRRRAPSRARVRAGQQVGGAGGVRGTAQRRRCAGPCRSPRPRARSATRAARRAPRRRRRRRAATRRRWRRRRRSARSAAGPVGRGAARRARDVPRGRRGPAARDGCVAGRAGRRRGRPSRRERRGRRVRRRAGRTAAGVERATRRLDVRTGEAGAAGPAGTRSSAGRAATRGADGVRTRQPPARGAVGRAGDAGRAGRRRRPRRPTDDDRLPRRPGRPDARGAPGAKLGGGVRTVRSSGAMLSRRRSCRRPRTPRWPAFLVSAGVGLDGCGGVARPRAVVVAVGGRRGRRAGAARHLAERGARRSPCSPTRRRPRRSTRRGSGRTWPAAHGIVMNVMLPLLDVAKVVGEAGHVGDRHLAVGGQRARSRRSGTDTSFCGLVRTSRERTSRTIAAMSFCWLPMRLVSEPSPTPVAGARGRRRAPSGRRASGSPAARSSPASLSARHVARDAHRHPADRRRPSAGSPRSRRRRSG